MLQTETENDFINKYSIFSNIHLKWIRLISEGCQWKWSNDYKHRKKIKIWRIINILSQWHVPNFKKKMGFLPGEVLQACDLRKSSGARGLWRGWFSRDTPFCRDLQEHYLRALLKLEILILLFRLVEWIIQSRIIQTLPEDS